MKQGRPPKYGFHSLEVGESFELKGKAKKFRRQYLYQYRKNNNRVLELVHDGDKIFAKRIK